MRRDGRSGPSEDRSEYILPNYSTFGIMNTVGNLFHQIEEISVAPRTVLMIYQLTAISWLSTERTMGQQSSQCLYFAMDCHVKSENQGEPRGGVVTWQLGLAWPRLASVRMMFPPPPSPQLYNVDTTHQNKLPMSSTWRKYW